MAADRRLAPVVAIFTRVPVLGRVKTRLARELGDAVALDAQRALLEKTIAVVSTARGLDAEIWVDGDPAALVAHGLDLHAQRDGDLGARMLDAISDITSRGRPAIIIGSDCPVIDDQYLLDAAHALDERVDVVIGPAEDGGYVLIGMSRPLPELLLDMTWSTPTVRAQTLQRAATAGLTVRELGLLWDVDDAEDWRRWRGL